MVWTTSIIRRGRKKRWRKERGGRELTSSH